jgi:hypothetical protein
VYEALYAAYRKLYFAFGDPHGGSMGDVLPMLIRTAEAARREAVTTSAIG